MNRTTFGYVLMAAVAVGVIWVILKAGSRLQAPPDWSGKWQVVEPAIPTQTVTVAQSGIFLRLQIGEQPARAYRMELRGEEFWLTGTGQARQVFYKRDKTGASLVIPEPSDSSSALKLWRDANAPASVKRDGTAH